jgi:hypothetical protein
VEGRASMPLVHGAWVRPLTRASTSETELSAARRNLVVAGALVLVLVLALVLALNPGSLLGRASLQGVMGDEIRDLGWIVPVKSHR